MRLLPPPTSPPPKPFRCIYNDERGRKLLVMASRGMDSIYISIYLREIPCSPNLYEVIKRDHKAMLRLRMPRRFTVPVFRSSDGKQSIALNEAGNSNTASSATAHCFTACLRVITVSGNLPRSSGSQLECTVSHKQLRTVHTSGLSWQSALIDCPARREGINQEAHHQ